MQNVWVIGIVTGSLGLAYLLEDAVSLAREPWTAKHFPDVLKLMDFAKAKNLNRSDYHMIELNLSYTQVQVL